VARLNGLVGGEAGSSTSTTSGTALGVSSAPPPPPKTATIEDRKRQMQQLAAMGIAIPDEYRKDLAMSGDWQTLSVKRVETPSVKKESNDNDVKHEALAFGVRKRKHDDNQEEEEVSQPRKGWGSRLKTFPTSADTDVNLDALLAEPIKLKKEEIKVEENADVVVKKEEPEDDCAPSLSATDIPEAPIKAEDAETTKPDAPGTGIVFKKRKTKPVREK
jgi:hypothetical protein